MTSAISLPPLYDLTTFGGRVEHVRRLTSPRSLLAGEEELRRARQVLADYRKSSTSTKWTGFGSRNTPSGAELERLWQAKYLVDATFHPDTGEKVVLPFRMASFVPTNLLVTAGLLLPNPSTRSLIFWQWLNQSVNVGINWANANKTTPMSVEETGIAYGTAVTASVTVALGLSRWVERTSLLSYRTSLALGRFVPFVAVATAGVLNVFLMRRKELSVGIEVQDEDGHVVGKSTSAGWLAVSQTAASRVATAFPALTLPPLVLSQLEKTSAFRAMPGLAIPVNLALITGSLMLALPCAIAMFPQNGQLRVRDILTSEPKWASVKRKDGRPLEVLTFNRGL